MVSTPQHQTHLWFCLRAAPGTHSALLREEKDKPEDRMTCSAFARQPTCLPVLVSCRGSEGDERLTFPVTFLLAISRTAAVNHPLLRVCVSSCVCVTRS